MAKICRRCGGDVAPGRVLYCDDCAHIANLEARQRVMETLNERRRAQRVAKQNKQPRKKFMSIAEVNAYARERGITYGKAVQELEGGARL